VWERELPPCLDAIAREVIAIALQGSGSARAGHGVELVGRNVDGRIEPFEGKAGNADSPDPGAGCSSVHPVEVKREA